MEEEKADEDIEGGKDEHHHGNKHLLCARAVEFIQKGEKLAICVHQNKHIKKENQRNKYVPPLCNFDSEYRKRNVDGMWASKK